MSISRRNADSPSLGGRALRRTALAVAAIVAALLSVVADSAPASARATFSPTIFCTVGQVSVAHRLDGLLGPDYYRIRLYEWSGTQWVDTGKRAEGSVYATTVGGNGGRVKFDVTYGRWYYANVEQWEQRNGRWTLVYNGPAANVNNLDFTTGFNFCRATE